jgi:hypothetical protein
MLTASQRRCCHLGGFKGPYYYLYLTEGWAESRSKFGRGDLGPACWLVHGARAWNSAELSFTTKSQTKCQTGRLHIHVLDRIPLDLLLHSKQDSSFFRFQR